MKDDGRRESSPVPGLMLAAPHGRSGKTTLTLALLLAWRARGYSVQPFKKGPDFIDPSWLSLAAGRLCRNLDAYFMPAAVLSATFDRASRGADLSLVEGAMGLYDGLDLEGSGSSAEIAKLLNLPVVLVIDATRMTRSAAALVLGFQHFDPEVRIAGVILNRVARSRHEKMLRDAIEKYCGVPVLGAVPKDEELAIPDRHLGLIPAAERGELVRRLARLTAVGQRHLDVDGLLKVAGATGKPAPVAGRQEVSLDPADFLNGRRSSELLWQPYFDQEGRRESGNSDSSLRVRSEAGNNTGSTRLKVGVVLDQAFTFYYPENLEALKEVGAELVRINSLTDQDLPDIDALYLGGGFPEVFAAQLEANLPLRRALAKAVEEGLPVYAECGGLMYLGRSILWGEQRHEMVGVLPIETRVEARPQAHGYTALEATPENPLFPARIELRGHEFHNSRVVLLEPGLPFAFKMLRGTGIDGHSDGLIYKNVLASYNHLHVAAAPGWAEGFLALARRYRERKRDFPRLSLPVLAGMAESRSQVRRLET